MPGREKTCLWGFANNKGADQPAHPHNLISSFVIPLWYSIIFRIIMSEISILLLVSVAKETGLSLALSNTPKTGFVASRFNYNYCLKTGVIFLIMFVKPLSFTP